jgi:Helix-turn-helix
MASAGDPRAGWRAFFRFLTWQLQRTIGYVARAYATIGHDWMEGCPDGRPREQSGFIPGAELRRARLAAGFSGQEALAAKLGYDRSVIAKAETGERPPSPEVAEALQAELFPAGPDGLVIRLARLARAGLTGRSRAGSRAGWRPNEPRTCCGCGHRCSYRGCCR